MTDFTPTAHKDSPSWINDYFAQIGRLFHVRFRPGVGGIENFTQPTLSDIDSTPQVIPAETGAIVFPRGMSQDTDNNAIVFRREGIWSAGFGFGLTFDEENFARNITIEFYDQTHDISLKSTVISVGRNQAGTDRSVNLLVEVTDVLVNTEFVPRILSASDTFTNVVLESYSFNVTFVDELREA